MEPVPALERAPDGSLELRLPGDRPGRGVAPRLEALSLRGLSRQPLVRAMGRQKGLVVDATAGLGGDAFLIAAAGFRVCALERVQPLAELLADALAHVGESGSAAHRDAAARMSIMHVDAIAALRAAGASARAQEPEAQQVVAAGSVAAQWPCGSPVAVLLDPMYPMPDRPRSALAGKPIRLVRSLAGDDPDQRELFEAARACRPARIVVKRPHRAPPLVDAPDLQLEGKLTRLDVYLREGALR